MRSLCASDQEPTQCQAPATPTSTSTSTKSNQTVEHQSRRRLSNRIKLSRELMLRLSLALKEKSVPTATATTTTATNTSTKLSTTTTTTSVDIAPRTRPMQQSQQAQQLTTSSGKPRTWWSNKGRRRGSEKKGGSQLRGGGAGGKRSRPPVLDSEAVKVDGLQWNEQHTSKTDAGAARDQTAEQQQQQQKQQSKQRSQQSSGATCATTRSSSRRRLLWLRQLETQGRLFESTDLKWRRRQKYLSRRRRRQQPEVKNQQIRSHHTTTTGTLSLSEQLTSAAAAANRPSGEQKEQEASSSGNERGRKLEPLLESAPKFGWLNETLCQSRRRTTTTNQIDTTTTTKATTTTFARRRESNGETTLNPPTPTDVGSIVSRDCTCCQPACSRLQQPERQVRRQFKCAQLHGADCISNDDERKQQIGHNRPESLLRNISSSYNIRSLAVASSEWQQQQQQQQLQEEKRISIGTIGDGPEQQPIAHQLSLTHPPAAQQSTTAPKLTSSRRRRRQLTPATTRTTNNKKKRKYSSGSCSISSQTSNFSSFSSSSSTSSIWLTLLGSALLLLLLLLVPAGERGSATRLVSGLESYGGRRQQQQQLVGGSSVNMVAAVDSTSDELSRAVLATMSTPPPAANKLGSSNSSSGSSSGSGAGNGNGNGIGGANILRQQSDAALELLTDSINGNTQTTATHLTQQQRQQFLQPTDDQLIQHQQTNANLLIPPTGNGGGGGFNMPPELPPTSNEFNQQTAGPNTLLDELLVFGRIFVMGAIIVGDICGNSLVILSVCRHSKLRVTTNWFVVSLACADILVALFAMTFNGSVIISGRWLFKPWVCDFWNACDVLASTASILHLCCISIDRYIAITRPLDYPRKITTKRVVYAICGVWISSALLSYLPIFTGVYTTADHIKWREDNPDQCLFVVNRVYAVVSSSISFWIPSSIMVFTYFRIYKEATKQEKFIYKTQNMMAAPISNHHHHHHHHHEGNHHNTSNKSGQIRSKQRRSKSVAVSGGSGSNENRIRHLAKQQQELIQQQNKLASTSSANRLQQQAAQQLHQLSKPAHGGGAGCGGGSNFNVATTQLNSTCSIPAIVAPTSLSAAPQSGCTISERGPNERASSLMQLATTTTTSTTDGSAQLAESEPLTSGATIDVNNNTRETTLDTAPTTTTTTTTNTNTTKISSSSSTINHQTLKDALGGSSSVGKRLPAKGVAFDESDEDSQQEDSNSGQSTPTKRSISKMKREHKAAKTLGIIMGVFILCWLPFFSWYTPHYICGQACKGIVPESAVTILFWIGYFNSTLNPIIYAYFNHEFRDAFKKTLQWIFCCCQDLKCLRVNRPNDNQHYNCTYRSTQEIGLVNNG